MKILNFPLLKSENNNYTKINRLEDLKQEEYQFVHFSETNEDFESAKRLFGDNVVILLDDKVYVKIEAYRNQRRINPNSIVFCFFSDFDFSSFKEIEIINLIDNLIFQYNTPNGGTASIKNVIFNKCNFLNFEKDSLLIRNNIFFNRSYIDKIILQKPTHSNWKPLQTFKECKIKILHEEVPNISILTLSNNNLIFILIAKAPRIEIKDLEMGAFHYKRIDEGDNSIICDNVKIINKNRYLKSIDSNQYQGFLNTFFYLNNLKSMNSENLKIEKYIAYFSSRDSKIRKILYSIHRGYTEFRISLGLIIIIIIINFLLASKWLVFDGNALVYIFYPVDLFKNLIFKDFSIYAPLSIPKLILLITEPLLIFLFFITGLSLKKLYGFKIKS